MAIIEGPVTEEELRSLEEAGCQVLGQFTGEPFERGEPYVRVHVDAGVVELLEPPLCPYCGVYMGDPDTFQFENPDGDVTHYLCPMCGAVVAQGRVLGEQE